MKTKTSNNIAIRNETRRKRPSGSTLTLRSSLKGIIQFLDPQVFDVADRVFTQFDGWWKAEGRQRAIARAKLLYQFSLNYSLHQNIPEQGDTWFKMRKGFPKKHQFLRRHLRRGARAQQAVFTLLTHFRFYEGEGIPTLTPITEPGVVVCPELLKRIAHRFPGKLSLSAIKMPVPTFSVKSGPNGKSIVNAWVDLQAVRDCPEVSANLKDYLDAAKRTHAPIPDSGLPCNDLAWFMSQGRPHVTKRIRHSKLAVKREGGGKLRVFAMVDYWTQSAFKPLHRAVAEYLKRFPEDCTWDQDRGIKRVLERVKGGYPLESIDLSNATDRFPIAVQQAVLGAVTGDTEYAEKWARLLSKRDFEYKGQKYRYATGQPMGSYSSWPVFALSHHMVVRHALRQAKKDSSTTSEPWYTLLGDDIVMDPGTAKYYKLILSELGVRYNPSKSLSGNCAEFAKRILVPEGDVSGISPKVVAQVRHNPHLLPVVWDMVSRLSPSERYSYTGLRRFCDLVAPHRAQDRWLKILAFYLTIEEGVVAVPSWDASHLISQVQPPTSSLMEGKREPQNLREMLEHPQYIATLKEFILSARLFRQVQEIQSMLSQFEDLPSELQGIAPDESTLDDHPSTQVILTMRFEGTLCIRRLREVLKKWINHNQVPDSLPSLPVPSLELFKLKSPIAKVRQRTAEIEQAVDTVCNVSPKDILAFAVLRRKLLRGLTTSDKILEALEAMWVESAVSLLDDTPNVPHEPN